MLACLLGGLGEGLRTRREEGELRGEGTDLGLEVGDCAIFVFVFVGVGVGVLAALKNMKGEGEGRWLGDC